MLALWDVQTCRKNAEALITRTTEAGSVAGGQLTGKGVSRSGVPCGASLCLTHVGHIMVRTTAAWMVILLSTS